MSLPYTLTQGFVQGISTALHSLETAESALLSTDPIRVKTANLHTLLYNALNALVPYTAAQPGGSPATYDSLIGDTGGDKD